MYLSVKNAALFLGVSQKTVYRLIEARKIPYVRIGTDKPGPRSRVVIAEKDLERYATRNRVISNEEYVNMADLMLVQLEAASADRKRRMR